MFAKASETARTSLGIIKEYVYAEEKSELDDLRERVSLYQSKGWLSQQEHRKNSEMLEMASFSKENHDHITPQVESELDELEAKMNGTRGHTMPSRFLGRKQNPVESSSAMKAKPLNVLSSRSSNQRSTFIVDPKEIQRFLSPKKIANLFVETCFFARLGFVQPPCCLQCTYRESMKEAEPLRSCSRWVIWRKDAKTILHPHHLAENAVAVQCHAARKLLAGELVDSHKWDKQGKVLLAPRPGQ